MGRQISNEDELVAMMRSYKNVNVTVVDLASLTFSEQLGVVSQTDIFIGMHGAALTHTLFLPSHAAMIGETAWVSLIVVVTIIAYTL